MATFTSTPDHDDVFLGTAEADIFHFQTAHIDYRDTIVGGTGSAIDRLVFDTAGIIFDGQLPGVSGIEQVELAHGANRLILAATDRGHDHEAG